MSHMDDFFQALKSERPFDSNRVSEPSRSDIDVKNIHSQPFHRLIRMAEGALRSHQARDRNGSGVMLLGSAGVGKSHLLSRLYRWAHDKGTDGQERAVFVYLHNVMADPEQLPRYLMRNVISFLSEGRQGEYEETQLFRLLQDAVRYGLNQKGLLKKLPPGHHPSLNDIEAALEVLQRNRERRERDLLDVLLRVYINLLHAKQGEAHRGEIVEAALDWLSGDPVESDLAKKLGIATSGTEGSIRLLDDDHLEQVFLLLTDIAAVAGRPFILCVDQVDNLSKEKVIALTDFLHKLLDDARNLLVVTSGVKGTVEQLREQEIIKPSTWDRVAEAQLDLHLPSAADTLDIIVGRLRRFRKPYEALPAVAAAITKDPLFPLTTDWWREQARDAIQLHPRKVISWARDVWEAEIQRLENQGEAPWLAAWPSHDPIDIKPERRLEEAVDERVQIKLQESIAQRRLHQGSLPPDAGNLRALMEALLAHCLNRSPYTLVELNRPPVPQGKQRLPAFDLLTREKRPSDKITVTSGVALVITRDGHTTYHALNRMLPDKSGVDHRILVTDKRRPLKSTPGVQGLYQKLKDLGEASFRHIELSFEDHARLDALVTVLAQARVGDLEIEYPQGNFRRLEENEVVDAYHRMDLFRQHPLLREFVTEEAPTPTEGAITLDEERIRQLIREGLEKYPSYTTRRVAFAVAMNDSKLIESFPLVQQQINDIATRMHDEGLLTAIAQDDVLRLEKYSQG